MNLANWTAVVALCLLPFHSHEFAAGKWEIRQEYPTKIRKVVIDAGHGGKDAGSLGKYSQEKDIALSIALKVGAYITENLPDVKVVYTRKDDRFLELYERAQLANDQKADVFISIHCNSTIPKKYYINGTETYVMGLHTAEENLEVAKRENEVILLEDDYKKNYGGYDPNSPEAHIMFSMYQNAYLAQSISLAEKIENQFTTRLKRPSRGVKQAGFMVLRTTTMPSVLVETGFLSNSTEESYLRSEKGQTYLASAIYRAFKEYKAEMDGKGSVGDDDWMVEKPSNSSTNVQSNSNPSPQSNVISFKVQLASSSAPIDIKTGKWTAVKGLQQEKIDNLYKYVVGNFNQLNEAINLQQYWRQHGFPDAFVVSYQGNSRIPLATAKKILGIP